MISVAQPIFGDEEREAVLRVLDSGILAQGPEVSSFEEEFSNFVELRHCIAVNSGTSALHLSLIAAGIGHGDEVIVPSFSFAATANAVALTGARPIFADIELDFFNLDPDAAEAAITSRTRAIMPVHLYGHPADMSRFVDLCHKHDLLLLEDAAQAHLAQIGGKPVGSFGDFASFSFYPTKNMTAGEGGMIVTPHQEKARVTRLLRNQGMERRYENEIVGFNNRMTDLHAAIGRAQLKKVSKWTAKRRENARFLSKYLEGVVTPSTSELAQHVFHQYTIRVVDLNRDEFSEQLNKKGVGTGVYYPTPIHKLPSFNQTEILPKTELAASQCLSLPVHPDLTDEDLHHIVSSVNSLASAGA